MMTRHLGMRLLWLLCISSASMAQVDVSPFVTYGTYGAIKISPTGEFYATTVHLVDRTALVIIRRSDMQMTARVSGVAHSDVADFRWVNDERVVVSMAEKFGSLDQPLATGELHAMNADGSGGQLLVGHSDPKLGPGAQRIGVLDGYSFAHLVDDLADDARGVLIGLAELGNATPWTRIERLDVYNGRRRLVTRAPIQRARFVTDSEGSVRFARGFANDNTSKLYYREGNAAQWRLLHDQAQSGHDEIPLGFSADGKTVFLRVGHEAGPDSIVALELASAKRSEVLRDAVVDPYEIQYDQNRVPVGASFMRGQLRTVFFDEQGKPAKLQRMLEKAFPGSAVRITSSTRDGSLSVLGVSSDRDAGAFYLFDHQSKAAHFIFNIRDGVDPAQMGTSKSIEFKARDGLELYGHLTLPKGASDKAPLPMVLLPHGGPFGVFDDWEFDTDTQLLARAGYAVLRVNFRGSGNFGHAFQLSGAREWGGRMQDDLSDATRWAIEQRIADPKRICIVGTSYGAYAALMGLAREPGLYRCAVGYAGVYDLPTLHKADSRHAKWTRAWVEQWIGSDNLQSRSPNRLADRIKAPVFLAAGGEDKTAPIQHSRMMERALLAADVPVETLYFDSEGHGFYTAEHRRAYYVKLLDFLSRYLGGAKAR